MDLHERYLQQAAWTRPLRTYLFDKAGLQHADRVLEVGCGTGAILQDLRLSPADSSNHSLHVFGLDIDAAALNQCRTHAHFATLTRGDALALPYADAAFQITFCHFLLLWLHSPGQAIAEMKRVTRRGGHVLALAEPDYTRRVDEPPELAPFGDLQTQSLLRRGADISIGSRAADLFRQADVKIIEAGLISAAAKSSRDSEESEAEWKILESDLRPLLPEQALARARDLDRHARLQGRRRLYVPTYFVWGQV